MLTDARDQVLLSLKTLKQQQASQQETSADETRQQLQDLTIELQQVLSCCLSHSAVTNHCNQSGSYFQVIVPRARVTNLVYISLVP